MEVCGAEVWDDIRGLVEPSSSVIEGFVLRVALKWSTGPVCRGSLLSRRP